MKIIITILFFIPVLAFSQLPKCVKPVMNMGSNQSITLPTTSVIILGTATPKNSEGIKSYQWQYDSGAVTPTVVSPFQTVTQITGLINAGTYKFMLTALDSCGSSNSGFVYVTVNPAPPHPTFIAIAVATINSVTLSVQPNAAPISVSWAETSGPNTAKIASPNSITTTASGLIKGTYYFSATVKYLGTNSYPNLTTITTVIVTVK